MGTDKKAIVFAGIDVQISRGLAFCVLDHDMRMVGSGWVTHDRQNNTAGNLKTRLVEIAKGREVAIGIDAPRMPLPAPRQHYWDGGRGTWRAARAGDRGHGRHCEVVLKACGIANPQWTPCRESSPEWMLLGYSLFREVADIGKAYEVFPSASYAVLQGCNTPSITLDFANFHPGPKDMLDACISALTVREFSEGNGWEAGGGDGLGTIILPGKPPRSPVMDWPSTPSTL